MYTQQQQISRKKMINNRLIIAYHQCEVLLNHSQTTDTSPKPRKFEQQNKTFWGELQHQRRLFSIFPALQL